MKVGLLPLARATFDTEFAAEKFAAMLELLHQQDIDLVGSQELLFDDHQAREVLDEIVAAKVDVLLILQVTFTDAQVAELAAQQFTGTLAIWAIPEARTGGRLRLNSFCGLNLASHALSKLSRKFSYLFAQPDNDIQEKLAALLAGEPSSTKLTGSQVSSTTERGQAIASALACKKIARIGEHPPGFATCSYQHDELTKFNVELDELALTDLFTKADAVTATEVASVHAEVSEHVANLAEMDASQLDKSLRLQVALQNLVNEHDYDALALRCWPETFTEHGGAICGPAAMLGEQHKPCACEADVYGALTQLLLLTTAKQAVFLTDLVDLDLDDNTAVVWHCGQAPLSMCADDGEVTATIHSNRKMPLLYEFPLKAGTVTLARISQGHNETKLITAKAEMLARPLAFSGTAGVLQFAKPAATMLGRIIDSGLEHHTALVYGDYLADLHAAAAALKLPVLEL